MRKKSFFLGSITSIMLVLGVMALCSQPSARAEPGTKYAKTIACLCQDGAAGETSDCVAEGSQECAFIAGIWVPPCEKCYKENHVCEAGYECAGSAIPN